MKKNKNELNNEIISILGEILYKYKFSPKIKIIDDVKGSYILLSEYHIMKIKALIKKLGKI